MGEAYGVIALNQAKASSAIWTFVDDTVARSRSEGKRADVVGQMSGLADSFARSFAARSPRSHPRP
eukprot:4275588-Pyramimonas_sp.AAC.1